MVTEARLPVAGLSGIFSSRGEGPIPTGEVEIPARARDGVQFRPHEQGRAWPGTRLCEIGVQCGKVSYSCPLGDIRVIARKCADPTEGQLAPRHLPESGLSIIERM